MTDSKNPYIATVNRWGKPVNHGSLNTYRVHGCRCEPCKHANRDRQRRTNAARAEKVARGEIPEYVKHGTQGTYRNWGCRCELCKAAGTDACNSYYRRVLSVDARRLRNADQWDDGYDAKSEGRDKKENPNR